MNIASSCQETVPQLLRACEPLFGQWRIQDFLGSGSFACVYSVERQDKPGKWISALKVIPLLPGLVDPEHPDKSLRRMISKSTQEITTLYQLGNHSNVVGLQNFQIMRFPPHRKTVLICIMMDYLPLTLQDILGQGPVGLTRGIEILNDCLNGLAYIHDRDTLHRDIKPANIFLDEQGQAKIGDFGIARPLMGMLRDKTIVGTPLYMAPELFFNPGDEVYGTTTDIYALGLVAYRTFYGGLPFEGDSASTMESISRRMKGEPITCPPGLPPELSSILTKALAYDPGQRFQSAKRFKEALEAVRLNPPGKSDSPI